MNENLKRNICIIEYNFDFPSLSKISEDAKDLIR